MIKSKDERIGSVTAQVDAANAAAADATSCRDQALKELQTMAAAASGLPGPDGSKVKSYTSFEMEGGGSPGKSVKSVVSLRDEDAFHVPTAVETRLREELEEARRQARERDARIVCLEANASSAGRQGSGATQLDDVERMRREVARAATDELYGEILALQEEIREKDRLTEATKREMEALQEQIAQLKEQDTQKVSTEGDRTPTVALANWQSKLGRLSRELDVARQELNFGSEEILARNSNPGPVGGGRQDAAGLGPERAAMGRVPAAPQPGRLRSKLDDTPPSILTPTPQAERGRSAVPDQGHTTSIQSPQPAAATPGFTRVPSPSLARSPPRLRGLTPQGRAPSASAPTPTAAGRGPRTAPSPTHAVQQAAPPYVTPPGGWPVPQRSTSLSYVAPPA